MVDGIHEILGVMCTVEPDVACGNVSLYCMSKYEPYTMQNVMIMYTQSKIKKYKSIPGLLPNAIAHEIYESLRTISNENELEGLWSDSLGPDIEPEPWKS
jgi:hypothetical protein